LTYFISSYCSIKDCRISGNGEVVFWENSESLLAEVLNNAYEKLQVNYPKFYKMDNLAKLGLLATDVLLKGRVLKEELGAEKVAVVLSNASSSLDTDLRYFETTKLMASPALFVYTLPNIAMGEICIRHGLKGENAFFLFDKFNPRFVSNYVDQVLDQGAAACVAGWIEVLGEHYNVFLYLAEKNKQGLALAHTTEQLLKLY
jgi:hypothetical protein